MKRWVSAITGLLLAASGPSASAKDLPTIDAFVDSTVATRAESRAQVQSKVKGARISGFEPRVGMPTFVWGNNSQVDARLRSALQRMSPEQAARVHLGRLSSFYKLPPEVASRLPAATQDSGKGPITVTFKQELDGVELFRQQLTVLLNSRHELIAASGFLSPYVTPEARGGKLAFKMDAPAAIARAFADLNGEQLDTASLVRSGQPKGKYVSYELTSSALARSSVRMVTPARAKRVFFSLPDQLVPAWYVELHTGAHNRPDADAYAYVISAKDGKVLFRHNLTVSDAYSYRVWAHLTDFIPYDGPQGLNGTPHPTGLPDGYQAPFVDPNLITLQNYPFSQNDPWLPAGATETVGNNVDAYADISGGDGRDAQDFRADVTAPSVFDRVYDVTQEPDVTLEQQKASVTQLFYVTNFLHDWFYDSGFDEAAGNAQTDNFGRGGEDGDSLRAEAQDFSGLNNANMFTPADGARPRMQMYLFTPNVPIMVSVLTPASIAGDYAPGTAEFGPASFDVSGEAILVQDAGGASLSDGCDAPFANAAAVAGKIAVIDRGNCNFVLKTKNAQDAGAVGVIIANNAPGAAPGMSGTDPTVTIPTLSLSQDDGGLIKTELASGAVTVRLFAGSGIFRDGALDNAIVAHEWGHYISNRLIYDGSGLGNNQGGSMGEGWADFHALLMMVREEDKQAPGNENWQGAYGTGGYVSSGGESNGYLFGVRRYPYSTDFTKNPLTFKHIEDDVALPTTAPINPESGGPNAEVHNSGEVWATMLWECYTSLLRDSQRLTFAQAQARMKAYLVNGYKLTPPSPTFLEARDALLAAMYAEDPADFELCHAAFARRGAGLRAEAPSRGDDTHADVVESFATGKDVELAHVEIIENPNACDGDGVLDNKEAGVLYVELRNTGTQTLTQTTARVTAPAGSGLTFAHGGLITLPAIAPSETGAAEVAVTLDGPAGIQVVDIEVDYGDEDQAIPGRRTVTLSTRVNTDDQPNASASDDVESTLVAWALDSDPDLESFQPWSRYEEEPQLHYFYGVNAPLPTGIYLTSPPLNVADTGEFSFTFSHRYAFEVGEDDNGFLYYYDGGVIELSTDDGQTWTDIGSAISSGQGYDGPIELDGLNPIEGRQAFAGISPGYPDWLPVTVSLGTAYQGQTLRIRFRIGTDESAAFLGWHVDDVAFSGITNTPFPALVPEADACEGNTAPVANAGPDQTVDAGTLVALSGSGTDADGDELTYAWSQTDTEGDPLVDLQDSGTATPTFTAPSVTTTTVLTFTLTVSDGGSFATDTVNITVNPLNAAPEANAGADQMVDEGTVVTLDGRGSSDPNPGTTLTYSWAQTAGPTVTLTGGNTATASFPAPSVEAETVLTFELTVSDGALSTKDTVSITVRNVAQNQAPTASAGEDQTVQEGASVTLSGSGTDPEGGPLTYAWTRTAGPSVTLTGGTTATATFTAPDVSSDTVLTFTLKVTDEGGLSAEDTVSITVRPEDDGGGDGGGDGGDDDSGCGCSSGSSAAGSLMPLLMIGMALLSRRRQWLK